MKRLGFALPLVLVLLGTLAICGVTALGWIDDTATIVREERNRASLRLAAFDGLVRLENWLKVVRPLPPGGMPIVLSSSRDVQLLTVPIPFDLAHRESGGLAVTSTVRWTLYEGPARIERYDHVLDFPPRRSDPAGRLVYALTVDVRPISGTNNETWDALISLASDGTDPKRLYRALR